MYRAVNYVLTANNDVDTARALVKRTDLIIQFPAAPSAEPPKSLLSSSLLSHAFPLARRALKRDCAILPAEERKHQLKRSRQLLLSP
jgi:hypothetical protein